MPQFVSPGAMVRGTVKGRMSNATTGFNACYVGAQGLYPNAPNTVIDFSNTSKNLFEGNVSLEMLRRTTTFKYPAMALWVAASVNTNVQKYQRFAGPVKLYAKFFLSGNNLSSSQAPKESEAWLDAIEGAMVEVFHNPISAVQTNWDGPVVYNGDLACQRGPLDMGASNWFQEITFMGSFLALSS